MVVPFVLVGLPRKSCALVTTQPLRSAIVEMRCVVAAGIEHDVLVGKFFSDSSPLRFHGKVGFVCMMCDVD